MRLIFAFTALVLPVTSSIAQTPGFLQCAQGRPEQAIPVCDELLRKSPAQSGGERATILSARGNAYLNLKQLDLALADFNEAIRLDPKLAHSYNGRGAIFRLRGEYDKAIAEYSQAINLQPNRNQQAIYFQNRGNAFRWKGDFEKAIEDFNAAIERNPQYAFAYNNRGWAYRMRLDFKRALSDFDAAIRLVPNQGNFYAERGATHEAKDDLQSALADFRRAQQLLPSEKTTRAIARIEQRMSEGPGSAAPTAREIRVALVIGNSRYSAVPPLANPKNDAATIAGALREVGFAEVVLKQDLSRAETVEALQSFARRADRADWAVVYFAGHGMEVNGTNYLLPVDTKVAAGQTLAEAGLPLGEVMQAVEGARKLRFVILDACRDNPFSKSGGGRDLGRSVSVGLTNVEPEGATLIAYAARHGQTALDGTGSNSPFVSALVRHLRTPNLEINLMLRKVRDDVLLATGRKQEPFTYGSLPSEPFFFAAR